MSWLIYKTERKQTNNDCIRKKHIRKHDNDRPERSGGLMNIADSYSFLHVLGKYSGAVSMAVCRVIWGEGRIAPRENKNNNGHLHNRWLCLKAYSITVKMYRIRIILPLLSQSAVVNMANYITYWVADDIYYPCARCSKHLQVHAHAGCVVTRRLIIWHLQSWGKSESGVFFFFQTVTMISFSTLTQIAVRVRDLKKILASPTMLRPMHSCFCLRLKWLACKTFCTMCTDATLCGISVAFP